MSRGKVLAGPQGTGVTPGTGEGGRAAGPPTEAREAVGSGLRARASSPVSKVAKINVVFAGEKEIKDIDK